MKKRILSMLLALVTLLSMLPIPANAASSLEEAMAEVNVYGKKEDLNWLTMSGSVKVQHYTYYNYRSPFSGETKEIPAYCVDPNLYGVPALAPDEGTPIKYSASETGNDPKIMGIIANGYPHIDLGTLGVNTIEEAYYATKTALWCYLLPNWDISKLGINPALSGEDRAAAERVLAATEFAYTRGMRWNALVEPKMTATPDRDTAYPVTINGEQCYQQVFKVTSETWSYEPVLIELAEGAPAGAKILDMNNNPVSSLSIYDATNGNDGYSWSVKVVYPKSSIEGQTGTCRLSMRSTVVQYEIYFAKTLERDTYGNIQEYMLDTDPYNCVFVGADEKGIPRHAHLRNTNSFGGAFRINVEGSDPRYSFHHIGRTGCLLAFEAPIDMMSYITLRPDLWQEHSYVACCGMSIMPIQKMLERMPRVDTVFLCHDNDGAGHRASERIASELSAQGVETERLCSKHKDWNEDLVEQSQTREEVAPVWWCFSPPA